VRVTVTRARTLSKAALVHVRDADLGVLLRRCGGKLDIPRAASLALRCTDDAELRALNRDFAGEDRPTDVLAFPGDGEGHFGDIAISVERAAAQAPSAPAEELRLLAVHGLLHCCGYDHSDAEQAVKMTQITRQLLPDQNVPELVTH
jgi:probable rRNA maturation factor